jgi:methionyl-tRNA synthetase
MDKQKYIVTAALTYANGDTHLGHIAGSILPADLYARYRRLRGDDIIFVCGSDEYGTAIEMAAIKEGITPNEIIDKYHYANKQAYADLGISFDIYSRTSLDIHRETAQEIFLDIYNKGLLYEKTDTQLYSPKEDRFLADRFVIGTCPVCGYEEAQGDQCENCGSALSPLQLINPRSKISGDTPIVKESKHLYFPLSKFQPRLEEWINGKKHWKPNVVNYCKGWFKTGLQDRAVTRDLKWGVPVPIEDYKDKVLYVWIDAPIGYISATKDLFIQRGTPDKWKEYWLKSEGGAGTKLVHFLGKDNIIFHAIMFPAMLMAQGDYVLEDNVPANEFMNIGGQKFSKSKGIGWLVKDVVKEIPSDVVRYAITSVMPENKDSDFNWDDFTVKNNSELAAILGNFINRTVVFAKTKFDNVVPIRNEELLDNSILLYVKNHKAVIAELYESYKFKEALAETMNVARAANKYFNDSEPWKVIKEDKEKCGDIINNCLQLCYSLAILISPVLPDTSAKIFKILNAAEPKLDWDAVGNVNLESMKELGENIILFPQMEMAKEYAEASAAETPAGGKKSKEKGGKTGAGTGANVINMVDLISIDDFKKVTLRTAKIVSCEKIEKSQKLLKLQLDAGGKQKQIVSGIAEHYTPEELIGKTIIIVDNLKPSKLMGVKSEGMLLAAKQDGVLRLITTDGEMGAGAEVS